MKFTIEKFEGVKNICPESKACINIGLSDKCGYYLVKVVEEVKGYYFFSSLNGHILVYIGKDDISNFFERDKTYVVFGYVTKRADIREFIFMSPVIYQV